MSGEYHDVECAQKNDSGSTSFFVCMAAPGVSHADVINLNTATKAELLEAPIDMNRAMVTNLIKYREEHGPFHSVEDLH